MPGLKKPWSYINELKFFHLKGKTIPDINKGQRSVALLIRSKCQICLWLMVSKLSFIHSVFEALFLMNNILIPFRIHSSSIFSSSESLTLRRWGGVLIHRSYRKWRLRSILQKLQCLINKHLPRNILDQVVLTNNSTIFYSSFPFSFLFSGNPPTNATPKTTIMWH